MKLLRILLTLANLVFVSLLSYAIPAQPVKSVFTQPDGTTVDLTLVGDEYIHYHITKDRIPVFEAQDGSFRYGYIENDIFKISEVLVHNIEDRDASEAIFVNSRKEVLSYLRGVNANKITEANTQRRTKKMTRATLGQYREYKGDFKGLVLLVEFPNLQMTSEYATLDFSRMFNGRGYSDNGARGSVSDYFRDQSYGQFNLSFDVVGPLMMEREHSYYGSNDPISGNDKRVKELIKEACTLADSYVNYGDYDWDHDGEVDQVFIVYAGYGENAGAPSNTIWPHESSVASLGMEFDGVKIGTYACSCELAGNRGTVMAGIGTACHEFSHCLGFPDLYDTDYSGAFGMGYWDLMNSGSHSGPAGNGEVPYGFSAYERWLAGWLTPTEITESTFNLKLRNLETYPEAYVIYNEANRDEFYMIENHQNTKWFSYVGTYENIHGMLVSHINYDARAWAANRVNPTADKQRLSMIPADNEYSYTEESYRNDLFPGPLNVVTLEDDSHIQTGGVLFNKSVFDDFKMHKCIVDISENEMGEITFGVYYNGNAKSPTVYEPEGIDESGYDISWSPVDEAGYYIVEQRSIDPGSFSAVPRIWTSEPVAGTSLRLDWIHNAYADTHVRVKAVCHGVSTEWSDYIKVDGSNAVNDIIAEGEEIIGIYSPNGTRLDEPLKGLNIVITPKGAKKVMVK